MTPPTQITRNESKSVLHWAQTFGDQGIMKTPLLITYCSILLISTRAYSQESVAAGGGGDSGFGNITLDVPEEEGQNDSNEGESNGNPNESSEPAGGSQNPDDVVPISILSNTGKNWKIGVSPSKDRFSLIIFVDETPKDVWSSLRNGERDNSQSDVVTPSNKYRSVVNKNDKVNSTNRPNNRPLLTNRDKRGGDCPNQSNDKDYDCDTAKDNPRDKLQCSCCCHKDDSGGIILTEDDKTWNQYQKDQPSSQGHTDDDDHQSKHENDNCYTGNENPKDSGYQDEQSSWDDDCDCDCDCRIITDILVYD